MADSLRFNGHSTSGDASAADCSKSDTKESIVIDLGGLTENDLAINSDENYDVTNNKQQDFSVNIQSRDVKMNNLEEMRNVALEMIENVMEDADEQVSAEHSDKEPSESASEQPETLGTDESLFVQSENSEPLGAEQESFVSNNNVEDEDSKQSWEVISSIASSKSHTPSTLDGTAGTLYERSTSYEHTEESGIRTTGSHISGQESLELLTSENLPQEGDAEQNLFDKNMQQISEVIGSEDFNCDDAREQILTDRSDIVQQEIPKSDNTAVHSDGERNATDTKKVMQQPSESEKPDAEEDTQESAEFEKPAEEGHTEQNVQQSVESKVLAEEGDKEQNAQQTAEFQKLAEEGNTEQNAKQPAELKKLAEEGNGEQNADKTQLSGEVIEQTTKITETENPTQDGDKEQISSPPEEKEDWVDVLGNGLLRKKVIQEGEGITTRPIREKEIILKYEAKLKGGEEIVDSNDHLALVLGEQDYLDLFDIVCALMQKGEKCIVESDSKYAFGEEGKPPRIPPNATIELVIELLQINEGPYSSDVDLEKRLSWADAKRDKGNQLYASQKYPKATMVYMKAIKALEEGWMNEKLEEARLRINELRLKCYNNLTVSQMKSLNWRDALKSCAAAEKLAPENIKTLFRKGKILCELGELEKGIKSFKKALENEPENKVIAAEITKQSKKLDKQVEKQKKMYQRMLGNIADEKTVTDVEEKSWLSNNWGRVLGGTLAIGAVLVGIYAAQKL